MNLIVRWDALGDKLFGEDSKHHTFSATGRDVLFHYREPWRHCFTDVFLALCLTEVDYVSRFVSQPLLLELAIWLRRVTYHPTRSDNEARSADYAERVMREWGMSEVDIPVVVRMIRVSAHVMARASEDEKCFCDVDLAIFGQSPSLYWGHMGSFRKEYAHIASTAYADWRISCLERLLARDTIYQTVIARGLYEDSARRNICNEISYLGRHRDTV